MEVKHESRNNVRFYMCLRKTESLSGLLLLLFSSIEFWLEMIWGLESSFYPNSGNMYMYIGDQPNLIIKLSYLDFL